MDFVVASLNMAIDEFPLLIDFVESFVLGVVLMGEKIDGFISSSSTFSCFTVTFDDVGDEITAVATFCFSVLSLFFACNFLALFSCVFVCFAR